MLEKFTPEEIRQIRRELREKENTDLQKRTVWGEAWEGKGYEDHREYCRLPHYYDFEKAAYLFADVISDNYITLIRKCQGGTKEYTKGNSVIPFNKSEEWSNIASIMIDIYIKKYKELING